MSFLLFFEEGLGSIDSPFVYKINFENVFEKEGGPIG